MISRANLAVAAVTMVVLQASVLHVLPLRAAVDDLSACDGAFCGMGSCRISSNRMFGFVCECDAGWNQLRTDDFLRFLPCIVPNCTFSYSCFNDSMSRLDPPLPNPFNFSFLDPCLWSYCGPGKCIKASSFGHRCECKEGFTNLLNHTTFPCFKDCALGADCVNLGFSLPYPSSSPSPPDFSHDSSSNSPASSSLKNLLWIILTTLLTMVQGATWMEL